jgi:mycoredoxin
VSEDIVMYGAFTYIDLESRPEKMAEVVARNGGMRSIPVIVFADGSHLTEPTDQQLADKIDVSA